MNNAYLTPKLNGYQFSTLPIKNSLILYQRIRHGLVHTYHWTKNGFKLFGANSRVSLILIRKKLKGYPLTFREHKLLVRTSTDLLKLIPFSFFIIVPFAEILLPPFLWIFPWMLPSTFKGQQVDRSYLERRLQITQELTSFFQELVAERTKQILHTATTSPNEVLRVQLLKDFHHLLLKKAEYETMLVQDTKPKAKKFTSPFLSLEETLQFAKLFKDEFKLENLPTKTLTVMCKMLGFEPYRLRLSTLLQLRHHILNLQNEDRQLLWEGVENLTHQELVEACKDRAMKFYDVSDDVLRNQLSTWLSFSSHKEITPVLLLWSRSITITHSHELTAQSEDQIPIKSDELLPEVSDKDTLANEQLKIEQKVNALQDDSDTERYRRLTAIAEGLKVASGESTETSQHFLDVLMHDDIGPLDVSASATKTEIIDKCRKVYRELDLLRNLITQQHSKHTDIIKQLNSIIKKYQQILDTDGSQSGETLLTLCLKDLNEMLKKDEADNRERLDIVQ